MDKTSEVDVLIDMITDLSEYLYNWCCCRGDKLHYIDHSKWYDFCLILFQQYKFNLYDIQKDIIKGKIILPTYIQTNPKFLALHDKLLEAHIKNVKEYEKKLNIETIL